MVKLQDVDYVAMILMVRNQCKTTTSEVVDPLATTGLLFAVQMLSYYHQVCARTRAWNILKSRANDQCTNAESMF